VRKLVRAKGLEPPHLAILEPKSSASTSSATPAAGPPVGGVYSNAGVKGNPLSAHALAGETLEDRNMATVPPPSTIPETPPLDPGVGGDDISAPPPDIDVPDPDPGDPGEAPGLPDSEAHPS
jgi:hypothetical protein